MIAFLKQRAENLFTGYFALVMATGALSIATYLLDMHTVAYILLYINIVYYAGLWLLMLIRLRYFFNRVVKDITSHTSGPGFFTLIAGTAVLGSQLIIVTHRHIVAWFLWFLAIVLWFIIMYTFFTAVTVKRDTPTIAEGINGAWLIVSVATQSVSILGTLLAPYAATEVSVQIILFFTISMYFLGCMLYLNIITLIFYRFIFVSFKFETLTPPYWINMGAVAITTLAGSTLILHADYTRLLTELTPFLKGFTLFFWAAGTWWIPLLFLLTIWRNVIHRYPLSYDPQYWAMAFPLAMYTASTLQFADALDVPFLKVIPKIVFFAAFFIWLVGFIGLKLHIFQSVRHRNRHQAEN